MYSPAKILVCVALISATVVSTEERKRRDVIDLRTSLPYQWQASNNYWKLRKVPNSILGGDSERQFANGGNGLPSEFSYRFPANGEARSLGDINGQRQPQFSEGLGNGQTISAKLLRPSVESNEIPLLRSLSLNRNQQQKPGVVFESINPTERFNAQLVGNQNILGQERSLGENIQLNPSQISTLQLYQDNNRINSQFLESQRPGQISGGGYNLLEDTSDNSQKNNEEQENGSEAQRNGLRGYSLQNTLSGGDRETTLQSQRGGYSSQFGLNQFQGIQEELRSSNNGRNQLYAGAERQRLQPTKYGLGINIPSRQEALEQADQEARDNSETTLNSYQSQSDGNQNNVAQQQPNIYSYGELSAKIWRVIQSNPSMLSNMDGLMEQLQSNNDSGNQEVRQLKSLLQEIGKYNRNSSPSSFAGQRDQNPLVKNLLDVMGRNVNNKNRPNIPTSYENHSRYY